MELFKSAAPFLSIIIFIAIIGIISMVIRTLVKFAVYFIIGTILITGVGAGVGMAKESIQNFFGIKTETFQKENTKKKTVKVKKKGTAKKKSGKAKLHIKKEK